MKSLSFLLIVILSLHCNSLVQAQSVPNGDFEEWLTCLCDPPYWYTNNLYPPPLECLQVSPGFPPYSGDFSIKGVVDSCLQLSVLYPPILTSYDIALNAKPEALHGFYKYFPIGEDLFFASIKLYKDSVLIGEGFLKSKQEVSDFTEFVINFDYTTNDIPDIAVVEFTIDSSLNDNQLHQGSKWYIDYLSFGPLSDVDDKQNDILNAFYLYQNFPNPFNPTTIINWQSPVGSWQKLKIYDMLGNEVFILVDEYKPAGTYDVEFDGTGLASGIYFYQLKTAEFLETKKMILLK